jgi:hypothetical protein
VTTATLLYRSPVTVGHLFTLRANSFDIHSHYSITLATCLSWILATVSHSVLCCMCVFSLRVGQTKVVCSFCIFLYIGRNRNLLADISFAHSHTVLSPQVLEFYIGSWPITLLQVTNIDWVMNLLSNSTTCVCTLNCRLTFAQVIVDSSIFRFSSVFPKLATGIISEALNGNDGANIGFTVPAKRHSVAPKKTVVWFPLSGLVEKL